MSRNVPARARVEFPGKPDIDRFHRRNDTIEALALQLISRESRLTAHAPTFRTTRPSFAAPHIHRGSFFAPLSIPTCDGHLGYHRPDLHPSALGTGVLLLVL